MTLFFWSQLAACGAFGCGLISFHFPDRKTILRCLTCLALFNSCHFFLLGRSSPAFMMILTATRYVIAMYSQRRELIALFVIASLVTFYLTFQGPLSFLALMGSLLGTVGSFQKSDRIMRFCFIGGNTVWMIHNLLARSPVGTVMEASFLISNVIGYLRFYYGTSAPSSNTIR